MKRPIRAVVLLALISLTYAAETVGAGPIKIFILSGQSNMAGWGLNTADRDGQQEAGTLDHLLANDPLNHYQFLSDGADGYAIFEDVWIAYNVTKRGSLSPGWDDRNGFGPELGFGAAVGQMFEQQVLIIKVARGGISLGHDFLPPSSEAYPTPVAHGDKGFWYHQILKDVTDVTANLETYFPDSVGQGYEIAGFGWHQGFNDRVTPELSPLYESHMVNFINDIRSDLGVPGLPFVIATTGMDGGLGYTEVERGQLAMADVSRYPDFAGNVAVVDTRIPYQRYDRELTFWQRVSDSPSDMFYHWNRNAKAYLNIGLAMADALTTIVRPDCPTRLQARASPNGVMLSWLNGNQVPTSVRVLRDGVELAAAAPAESSMFEDVTIRPSEARYELQFTMSGGACDPLTLSYNSNITDLKALRAPTGLLLTWKNNMAYAAIKIFRNGSLLSETVPGMASDYLDTSVPRSGVVTYQVVPTDGSSPTVAEVMVDLDAMDSAIIYEPFTDLNESLRDNQSGAGFGDRWVAVAHQGVSSESLTFGPLPASGGHSYRNGGGRVSAAVNLMEEQLKAAKLFDDGNELWMSFLCRHQDNNAINVEVALCTAEMDYYAGVAGGGEGDGEGIGVFLHRGQIPTAASWSPKRDYATSSGLIAPEMVGLVVAKFSWGANDAEPDTIEVYVPDEDLVLPALPVSTHMAVLDQQAFNTLALTAVGGVYSPRLDEIRIGLTYNQVIGDSSSTFLTVQRTIRMNSQDDFYVHEINPNDGVYTHSATYGIFNDLDSTQNYTISSIMAVAD